MIKATLVLLLFLSFALASFGVNTNFYFKQISVEQGLSQANVNSILYDHKGMLWIGTKSGLNCFNRHELKTYFNDREDKYSLPDNYILFIAEDSLNNIWVSTNKGLVRYNPENNHFDLIVREKIYSFLNINGGILFGGDKKIYKYDCSQRNMDRIQFPDQGKTENASAYIIVKMVELEKNKVLIGTKNKGLYIYDYHTKSFKKFFSGIHNILLSLCIGPDGLIYESSYGQGIYSYDRQGHVLANYNTKNSGINNNIVLDMQEKGGKLWIGTDGDGINIFDPISRQFAHLKHIPGDANSLPVNSITVLYKDDKDNLWAGSVRGGIFGIKETFIKTYTDVALNNTYGLSEKAIISMYEEKNGQVWIGTDGGGINLYDPYADRFTHYPSTYGDKIVSITGLSENELLVSLYSKGMFVFHKKAGRYTPFTIVNAQINVQECFYGFIPQGYKVGDNKIYILSKSPHIYHPLTNTFSQIKLAKGINPEAFQLAYSNDSFSYFMKGNQLFKVEQNNDSLYHLFSIKTGDNIHAVCPDKNILWIGTDQGLGYYDIAKKQYKEVQTKLFNDVSNLILDNKGRLWISAENMFFSYIIKENRFIVWSESDGFSPNEVLYMYQNASRNKYIYLGGTDGFVKIDTDIAYGETQNPHIELANIIFNGSSSIGRMKGHSIEIPWNYNSLTVAVRSNEEDIFRKTLFRFTIVGLGQQQVESYNPQLSLPSLLPGTYSILVSCNTKNGSYTPPVHLLKIIITPPWYSSIWFSGLCFLLIFGIIAVVIYSIMKKKANRLRWKMKEYEQEVNEEKINFLINVSHELRTPLTLIYAPLKRLIGKSQEDFEPILVKNQLQTIYKQARKMKNIINMVLDINRLNVGEETIKKQPHQLNDWVKTVSEDFRNEWQEKNIEVKFQMDEQVRLIWFDEWKCQIILSNLLMNALKFSSSDSHITIATTLKEDKARISVTDEGIGLQNVDISRLFSRFYQGEHNQPGSGIGLSYAKMIIETHGGTIGAFNNQEKGATFYFELPVAAQENILSTVTEQMKGNVAPTDIQIPLISIFYSRYSILIVDDEPELRDFLQETFKERFKCVYTAVDGAQALDICRNNQPDIVISDIMMPLMDGYDLCKEIKNDIKISHIPVILLTARGDQDSMLKGYKQGADFYIPKPFDTEFLFTIICKLFRFKEVICQKYKEGNSNPSPQEATISRSDENFLLKFNDIIYQNLSNPTLSINFLTKAMSMSRTPLYSKVKVLTGLGINDYINRLRIEKAVDLLTHSDLNINEISDEVGFTYSRYFSTVFKQIKGVTPTQFKEEIISKGISDEQT